MSLQITSSSINIKNSNGVTKFTSNDKLVYLRYERLFTHTATGAGAGRTAYSFYPLYPNEFTVMRVKFNSCSGNGVPASIIGTWIPFNAPLITNCNIFAGGAQGEPEVILSYIQGVATNSGEIWFNEYALQGGGVLQSTITADILVNARIYSYF